MADEYADSADVQKEFKNLEYNSQGVESTEVDEWATQESEYINSRIGLKYQTPVTVAASPKAFQILKQICIWLLAKRIQETLEVKTTVPEGQQLVTGGDLRTLAEARLDKLVDGSAILLDAISNSSSKGISSFTAGTASPHVFQKGDPSRNIKDQW